jgi:tRNA-splicing ligase RtcB (3'-phosphate/5'-hydroxy nucleic acid ligase)
MIKDKLKKINDFEWLLPKSVRSGMKVDGKIIASNEMIKYIEDEAINQLTNVAMLPGVINPVCAMPDAHWGYGLPMGSVAAFDAKEGVISSGLCGFDINCGINLIRTNLKYKDIKEKLPELMDELYKKIPVGVGTKNGLKLSYEQLDELMVRGAKWCIDNNIGIPNDLENMEENGCMEGADPAKVSPLAKKRGLPQAGTLGAGNHFIELQRVNKIHDKEFAKKCGINEEDQVCIMIHSGSRGFGHQIATDYLKIQEKAVEKYKIKIPDRQLACAPAQSEEGQSYYAAMKCAVNFSFANRLVMTQKIREVFETIFNKSSESMDIKTVYGICHNVVKLERFNIDGKERELFVHRKGATRSYPDQPVIIAGSMGTSSWLLKGTEEALQKSFGSSAHGAGRAMSRHAALKEFRGEQIKKDLSALNIESRAPNAQSFAEEAPKAYKDVDIVIESVHGANISLKTVELKPIGVIKG